MLRRRVLHGGILASATLLAGCIGSGGPGGDTDTTTTSDDPDPTTTTTAPPPCPNVRDASTYVCPGDDGGPISVGRSADSMAADGGSLEVTVENTSGATIGLNPYAWGVHRETDGGWERADAGRAYIEPWQQLAPGERVRWHVASDAESEPSGDAIAAGWDLDPGTYAWSVTLLPGGADERVAAVAGFHVTD